MTIAESGTPFLRACFRIALALLGPVLSAAAPENINKLDQPFLYNLTASSVRASVSPPLTATIASTLLQAKLLDSLPLEKYHNPLDHLG